MVWWSVEMGVAGDKRASAKRQQAQRRSDARARDARAHAVPTLRAESVAHATHGDTRVTRVMTPPPEKRQATSPTRRTL